METCCVLDPEGSDIQNDSVCILRLRFGRKKFLWIISISVLPQKGIHVFSLKTQFKIWGICSRSSRKACQSPHYSQETATPTGVRQVAPLVWLSCFYLFSLYFTRLSVDIRALAKEARPKCWTGARLLRAFVFSYSRFHQRSECHNIAALSVQKRHNIGIKC